MRVLIAAGGTAGHVNPALAIAGYIRRKRPDAEIFFAGREKGMEYGLVTKAGYPFCPIEVNGIQRRLTPKNIVRNVEAVYHLALAAPRAPPSCATCALILSSARAATSAAPLCAQRRSAASKRPSMNRTHSRA